jgi:2-polyprenyl-3-methyl-5-hydroxy-6-metoxy-1,4-benzoquinol methylase
MEACPVCGAGTFRRLRYPDAGGAAGTLRLEAILVCERCGTGTAVPRPEQATLDRFYASGTYWHSSSGAAQRAHELSQGWLRVERVQGFAAGGALAVADIGAGHGGIPRACAGLGVRVARYAFVEPDERAAADIGSLALPFAIERASSLSELRGPFDLLFLNHVLEHVADPLRFLEQAVAQVSSGGTVYVETPHADYRFKDDVFPHVFFFTAQALAHLGERLAVRTLICESFGRLPAARLTPLGLVQRFAARALAIAARAGWQKSQRVFDRVLWRYAPAADGIWLRWIFSVGTKAR